MSAQQNYWSAVTSLREAETLAQMAGGVSGPADEPPQPGDEPGWLEDWSRRAKEALTKARELGDSGKRHLKERARKIVARIQSGAAAARRAVTAPVAKANAAYQDVLRTANTLSYALLGAQVLMTAGLLYAAYKLFWT